MSCWPGPMFVWNHGMSCWPGPIRLRLHSVWLEFVAVTCLDVVCAIACVFVALHSGHWFIPHWSHVTSSLRESLYLVHVSSETYHQHVKSVRSFLEAVILYRITWLRGYVCFCGCIVTKTSSSRVYGQSRRIKSYSGSVSHAMLLWCNSDDRFVLQRFLGDSPSNQTCRRWLL